ncbi:MAG: hypothetical protein ACI4J0_05280 [Huintestinicola sp.]|uniref:hypothetical protein n=1 Tax=Huintestinicola sp. TaxID=2981661 RepID=UPI003F129016
MDNFKAEDSVKTAAMISQIILILWALLLLLSSLFQKSILTELTGGYLPFPLKCGKSPLIPAVRSSGNNNSRISGICIRKGSQE